MPENKFIVSVRGNRITVMQPVINGTASLRDMSSEDALNLAAWLVDRTWRFWEVQHWWLYPLGAMGGVVVMFLVENI